MTAHNTYTNIATVQHTHTHKHPHIVIYRHAHKPYSVLLCVLLSKVLFSYCDHIHNQTVKIKDSNSKSYIVKHKRPEQFNKINFK